VSSLARRYRSGGAGRADPGDLMPPDLRAYVAAPFGDEQHSRLNTWLNEPTWPRGHMRMPELEGYLVALIAWPVGIAAGAWLPPIWGQRGWRVPAKLAVRAQYEEFVALVVGFMRDLDQQISRQSTWPRSVLQALEGRERDEALHAWGRGFMMALTLGSQGFQSRSTSAGAAVRTIARNTSASSSFGQHAVEEVVSAVAALVEQRGSRGPLGPVES
jgi:yecA family protein